MHLSILALICVVSSVGISYKLFIGLSMLRSQRKIFQWDNWETLGGVFKTPSVLITCNVRLTRLICMGTQYHLIIRDHMVILPYPIQLLAISLLRFHSIHLQGICHPTELIQLGQSNQMRRYPSAVRGCLDRV
jgi:hypothetical protein